MNQINKFRLDDFELYTAAREFRKRAYKLARILPGDEKYCLGIQMRRAAVSVTNNIAEGHGRWHYQENMPFCRIARGSVVELLDDSNVCLDEEYGSIDLLEQLTQEAYMMLKRINGYVLYLKNSRDKDVNT